MLTAMSFAFALALLQVDPDRTWSATWNLEA
jgi:hypothetical protein